MKKTEKEINYYFNSPGELFILKQIPARFWYIHQIDHNRSDSWYLSSTNLLLQNTHNYVKYLIFVNYQLNWRLKTTPDYWLQFFYKDKIIKFHFVESMSYLFTQYFIGDWIKSSEIINQNQYSTW